MKKRWMKLFVAALLCVGIWGCWNESIEDVSRTRLVGYSGDSLVVYIEESMEETCLAKPLGDDCSTREKGTRIVVDNFYTEENVWKSNKIKDKYIENVYDLMDDTTMIVFDKSKSRFYRWTLGKGSEDLGDFEWVGCNTGKKVGCIRPWGDGKWRLVGSTEDCGYAIVDVEKKEITGYEKIDDFAEGCSDLWDHEGVKYCVTWFMADGVYEDHGWHFDYGTFVKNSVTDFIDTLWYNAETNLGGASDPKKLNSYISLGNALIRVNYENHNFDRNSVVKI